MILNKGKLKETPSSSEEAVSLLVKQLDVKGHDETNYVLEIRNLTSGTENKAVIKLYKKSAVIHDGTFMEIEFELLDCPLMGENLLRYMDSESMEHYLIASHMFFPPCTRKPMPNGRLLYMKNISAFRTDIIENNPSVFGLAMRNLLQMMNDLYLRGVDDILGSYPTHMVYLGLGANSSGAEEQKKLDAYLRVLFKAADFAVFECIDDEELDEDEYYLATFCSWALTNPKSLEIQKAIKERDEPLCDYERELDRPFKHEGDWCRGNIKIGNIEWEQAQMETKRGDSK